MNAKPNETNLSNLINRLELKSEILYLNNKKMNAKEYKGLRTIKAACKWLGVSQYSSIKSGLEQLNVSKAVEPDSQA